MAKKSMIAREKKREALVKKYAAKRAALKEIIVNSKSRVSRCVISALPVRSPAWSSRAGKEGKQ